MGGLGGEGRQGLLKPNHEESMTASPAVQGSFTLSTSPTASTPLPAASLTGNLASTHGGPLSPFVHQPQLGGSSTAAPSAVGLAGSATITSIDAANEARRLLRSLLDTDGQSRLSLFRVNKEVEELKTDV